MYRKNASVRPGERYVTLETSRGSVLLTVPCTMLTIQIILNNIFVPWRKLFYKKGNFLESAFSLLNIQNHNLSVGHSASYSTVLWIQLVRMKLVWVSWPLCSKVCCSWQNPWRVALSLDSLSSFTGEIHQYQSQIATYRRIRLKIGKLIKILWKMSSFF